MLAARRDSHPVAAMTPRQWPGYTREQLLWIPAYRASTVDPARTLADA